MDTSEQQFATADETQSLGEESGGETEPEEPSLDVIFDILRNERRRLVLRAVKERGGSTTLGELAEHIGGIENGKPPDELDSKERKRVYVGLYQTHLPKMDDAGAVRYDQDRGTIEEGPSADAFQRYLDYDDGPSPRRYFYYGALAATVCLSLLGAALVLGGI